VKPTVRGCAVADEPDASWSMRSALSSYRWQLAIALALAVAARLWIIVSSHGMLDGDEAVLGIQAEDILRGAHPIYFYGQPFMGSWDAYLLAPIVAVFGPSAYAIHAVTLAESLPLVPLLGALAGRLYGERARLPAMLIAALPPLYVSVTELRMLGGYVETLVLGTALLLVVVTITEHWRAGRPTGRLWLMAGLLSGLGLWIDILMGYYVLACALWLAPLAVARLRRGRAVGGPWLREIGVRASGALVAAVVGAAPALWYGLHNNWANVTWYLQERYTGPDTLHVNAATYLTTIALPRVIGVRSIADGSRWGHLLNSSLGLIVAAVSVMAVLYAIALPVVRWRRGRVGAPTEARLDVAGLWALCCAPLLLLTICILYWRSALIERLPLFQYIDFGWRYALPIITPLSLLLTALVADLPGLLGSATRRLGAAGRLRVLSPGVLRLAASLTLAVLLLSYGIPYVTSDNVQALKTTNIANLRFPAEHAELLSYLEQQHIHYVWTFSWVGHVIMYLEDGRVQCADLGDAFNRFPSAMAAVARADRPSFIVMADPTAGEPDIERRIDVLHVRYMSAQFGSLWVITPLSRTVQPAEVGLSLGSV
jgi:hypothetical protein